MKIEIFEKGECSRWCMLFKSRNNRIW